MKVAVSCEGWMSHKNYKGPRDPNRGACKRPARWHFTPLDATDSMFSAKGGDLCFSHLIYTGVCGSMDEEQRTREWLEKYREGEAL